jgi:hypothetical protein
LYGRVKSADPDPLTAQLLCPSGGGWALDASRRTAGVVADTHDPQVLKQPPRGALRRDRAPGLGPARRDPSGRCAMRASEVREHEGARSLHAPRAHVCELSSATRPSWKVMLRSRSTRPLGLRRVGARIIDQFDPSSPRGRARTGSGALERSSLDDDLATSQVTLDDQTPVAVLRPQATRGRNARRLSIYLMQR